jgi:AmmeMemoRadiSam system protein B
MAVRLPSVAGMFYPAEEAACRRQVVACLGHVPPAPLPRPIQGGVVPHAGWTYSGPTAGRVFAALAAQGAPETVVLAGAVHSWGVSRASLYGSGAWRTPLGDLPIDEELAQQVLRDPAASVIDRPEAHGSEHSIEVQTPFIKYLFPDARILPVAVPPTVDVLEVGRQLARAARDLGRRAVILGSSDLTHYGPRYGFAPVGVGEKGLQWARQNDERLLDLAVEMRAADIVPEATRHGNACGGGAIAAAIAFAAQMGAQQGTLLQHTTSHEALPMGRPADLVGYAAIVFC